MNKTAKNMLLILLAVVLAGGGIFVGVNWNNWFGKDDPVLADTAQLDSNAEDYTGDKGTYTGKKNTDSIDIPGYGSISFQADTKEQSVNFYNPEANTCYFKMSLLLFDGTKLWESRLIEPGKGLYNITLDQTLSAGSYEDAVLKYECFAMNDDQTPLNGSEIKLTLNVLE